MFYKFLLAILLLQSFLIVLVSTADLVQCVDSCTFRPSILAPNSTIGDCCGVQGKNAEGFITGGGESCISCSRFRTLSAVINISSIPMVIFLGSEVRILCEVRIEEILCPSGSFFLQLPNGTVITEIISASMSIIELNIAATSLKDFGRYYCNISIISPQFPNIGLRAFEGLQLQISPPSVSATSTMPDVITSVSMNEIGPTLIPAVPTVSITTPTTNIGTAVSLPTEADFMPTSTISTATQQAIPEITPTPTIPSQTTIDVSTDVNFDFSPAPSFESIVNQITSSIISTVDEIFVTSTVLVLPDSSSSSMFLPSPSPILPDPTIFCLKYPIIGRKFKITCQSNKLNLKMLWTSRSGRKIRSNKNILVGKTIRNYFLGKSSLTVYFQPFLMEHIGSYTCWTNIDSVNVLISTPKK